MKFKNIIIFIVLVFLSGCEINSSDRSSNINFKTENTTKINHQQNDTECGIYCLYLIINLLEERKTVEDFKTKIIRDEEMEPFRKIYFNSD